MAKTPGPPKAKTAAPVQFDMNSRERKGGKGGPGGPGRGGPGRGGSDKRPPSQIVTLPAVSVDRGEGWIIQKIGKIDQASHVALGAEYRLVFEGHEALVFQFLGAARERAKEGPPEKVEVAEVVEVVEVVAESAPVEAEAAAHVPGEEV